ncbi:prohibitin family protein [[Clostridium] colinum]|uniref:prohibitin family protein n=1 Tax=[Clostridium] colinum TaxID=36835 RepID=UPI002024B5E6|nr:prohibitin family protein [[Clostridium] colinum]
MKKKVFVASEIIVLLASASILLYFSTTIIKAGYVGIQYSLNGGIKNEVLEQGLRFKSPIVKVTKYPISRQQVYLSANKDESKDSDSSFNIPTSDGKSVSVDLEFSYKFDVNNLAKTYTEFRGKSPEYIEETFIRAKMKSWSGEVSSKFSLIDIYGEKRTDLNNSVQSYVAPKFEEYGIIIEGVSFTQIRLDEETTKAIQNKINKQQEVETSKLELEKSKIENQKKIEQAEAEAKQIKIKAQAEADANKTLSQSITENLIKLKEVEARDKHGWITVNGTNTTAVIKDE